jgi:hypothetical protein
MTILVIFDLKKPSIVETDALDKAIRVVAYLSRKFILAKSYYKVYNKELLTIIESFRY